MRFLEIILAGRDRVWYAHVVRTAPPALEGIPGERSDLVIIGGDDVIRREIELQPDVLRVDVAPFLDMDEVESGGIATVDCLARDAGHHQVPGDAGIVMGLRPTSPCPVGRALRWSFRHTRGGCSRSRCRRWGCRRIVSVCQSPVSVAIVARHTDPSAAATARHG